MITLDETTTERIKELQAKKRELLSMMEKARATIKAADVQLGETNRRLTSLQAKAKSEIEDLFK